MDNSIRGRQPQNVNITRSRSPSTHHTGFNEHANALGLDPSLTAAQSSYGNPTYNATAQQQQQQQQTFTSEGFAPNSSNNISPAFAEDLNTADFLASDFSTVNPDAISFNSHIFDGSSLLNPQALGGQQPDTQAYMHQTQNMAAATMGPHASHHPHLFPSESHDMSQQSVGDGVQPDFSNQPLHSRNQSLDPSSAAMMGRQNGDWSGMQFSTHRHTPSDQYSDVSSSAVPSPYLASDNFDPTQSSNSPLLQSTDAPLFNEGLSLEQFTLNDSSQQRSHISPGHSPHISPNVSPQMQEQMPLFAASEHLGFANLGDQYGNGPGPDVDGSPDEFPALSQAQRQGRESAASFKGTMSPPEINIEPAIETQSTLNEPPVRAEHSGDALSPPLRSPSRMGRQRAISESYITPTSSRGSSPMRPRSPSLGLRPGGILSPQHASRSSSPAGGVQKPRRLSSPENRHWAIGLAERGQQNAAGISGDGSLQTQSPYMQNPNSATASTGTDSNRRVQKHPATFQCHLCPKRFTRAYNLRSHLRTHTDERPFVCTVCRKAFARQHDRKRHEGLHSGEKKFVCKGLLQSAINSGRSGQGQTWGCGRRFARADALGRHFRSEAGRACIKPLLEEEARERRAAAMEQANQDMLNNGGIMQAPPQPDMALDSATFSEMALPAALLQQYPALADIQWNAIPGPGQEDEYGGDASGRSSFDASSGPELDYSFEDEGEGGYVSGPGAMDGGTSYNNHRLNADWSAQQNGWSSDYDGRS